MDDAWVLNTICDLCYQDMFGDWITRVACSKAGCGTRQYHTACLKKFKTFKEIHSGWPCPAPLPNGTARCGTRVASASKSKLLKRPTTSSGGAMALSFQESGTQEGGDAGDGDAAFRDGEVGSGSGEESSRGQQPAAIPIPIPEQLVLLDRDGSDDDMYAVRGKKKMDKGTAAAAAANRVGAQPKLGRAAQKRHGQVLGYEVMREELEKYHEANPAGAGVVGAAGNRDESDSELPAASRRGSGAGEAKGQAKASKEDEAKQAGRTMQAGVKHAGKAGVRPAVEMKGGLGMFAPLRSADESGSAWGITPDVPPAVPAPAPAPATASAPAAAAAAASAASGWAQVAKAGKARATPAPTPAPAPAPLPAPALGVPAASTPSKVTQKKAAAAAASQKAAAVAVEAVVQQPAAKSSSSSPPAPSAPATSPLPLPLQSTPAAAAPAIAPASPKPSKLDVASVPGGAPSAPDAAAAKAALPTSALLPTSLTAPAPEPPATPTLQPAASGRQAPATRAADPTPSSGVPAAAPAQPVPSAPAPAQPAPAAAPVTASRAPAPAPAAVGRAQSPPVPYTPIFANAALRAQAAPTAGVQQGHAAGLPSTTAGDAGGATPEFGGFNTGVGNAHAHTPVNVFQPARVALPHGQPFSMFGSQAFNGAGLPGYTAARPSAAQQEAPGPHDPCVPAPSRYAPSVGEYLDSNLTFIPTIRASAHPQQAHPDGAQRSQPQATHLQGIFAHYRTAEAAALPQPQQQCPYHHGQAGYAPAAPAAAGYGQGYGQGQHQAYGQQSGAVYGQGGAAAQQLPAYGQHQQQQQQQYYPPQHMATGRAVGAFGGAGEGGGAVGRMEVSQPALVDELLSLCLD